MTLRLALLVDSPSRGTYANAVGRLAIGLAETGRADTTLVCYRDDPPPPWLPQEVRVHHLGTGRASASLPALVRYLWKEQPDVLISRQIHVNLLSLGVSAAAHMGGRWPGKLVLCHDHLAELSHASNWRDNKWLVKLGYRFADGVVTDSPAIRDDVIRWCRVAPHAVAVVPIPVTTFTASGGPPPHPWLGEPTPVFITVSHLVGWKRLDLVVQAFAALRGRQDARLLIIGEGVERRCLDEQIERLGLEGSAQTLGWVADPRDYASRATALIHASDEEGFAQVLTEAMSARCPVIAADALGGGPRYVTGDGQYGILIPRGDVGQLLQAMVSMVQPSIRARYAELGYRRSRHFSPRASGLTVIDFLERLGCQAA